MITSLNEFTVCPNCGSTEYLKNYPAPGTSICAKCAHEIAKIKLKEMSEEEIYLQNCPFCGKEGEEDDTLFVDEYVIVFKCKGCKKLDGYRVALKPINPSDEPLGDQPHDRIYKPKAVSLDKLEGNMPVYSAERAKEIAKAIEKMEKNPKKQCEKQLKQLIREKQYQMQKMGLPLKT